MGAGIGIPLFALIGGGIFQKRLAKVGIARWDEKLHLIVRHKPIAVGNAIIVVLFFLSLYALAIYGESQ